MSEEKIKVLVVDDLEENLFAMEDVLEDLNDEIEIITAISGEEALLLLMKNKFAVVLLDVQMPEMNGFEVASMMKLNKKTKNTPIIFVTAISKEDAYVFKGYESGAVDYLFKPIKEEILKSKVKVFITLFKQQQVIEKQKEELEKFIKIQSKEIDTLQVLLPICANCKKIKDDAGYWDNVEIYIKEQTNTELTHSICPTCIKKLYPDMADEIIETL